MRKLSVKVSDEQEMIEIIIRAVHRAFHSNIS